MIATKIVHIVSIPERIESLKLTVESIIDQVDEMYVMLNDYKAVPWFVKDNPKIHPVTLTNAMSDANKAYLIEDRKGYVFLLDDDITVPSNYCQYLIDGINKYSCIISLHGKRYSRPFRDFYRIERNYRCLGNTPEGGYVDVVGSGVCAFHSDDFKLRYSDFHEPNMADIWLSKVAKEQKVPMYVLPHKADYLKHTPHRVNIFQTENAKKFVRQTEILKSFLN